MRSLKAARHTVLSLSSTPRTGSFAWDPLVGEVNLPHELRIDAVIHLAGANIAEARWSKERKALIRDSRVKGTELLVNAILKLQTPPKTLLSASGVGIYGDRHDTPLDEDDQPGEGFLVDVAREWEAATRLASHAGIRVVNLRIGVVLSKDGGVLKRILPIYRCGLGAVLGSGNQ